MIDITIASVYQISLIECPIIVQWATVGYFCLSSPVGCRSVT